MSSPVRRHLIHDRPRSNRTGAAGILRRRPIRPSAYHVDWYPLVSGPNRSALDGRYRLTPYRCWRHGSLSSDHTVSRDASRQVLKPESPRSRCGRTVCREAFASCQLDHPNIVAVLMWLPPTARDSSDGVLEGDSPRSVSREQRLACRRSSWSCAHCSGPVVRAGSRDRALRYQSREHLLSVSTAIPPQAALLRHRASYSICRRRVSDHDRHADVYVSRARAGSHVTAASAYSASVVLYGCCAACRPFAERTPRNTLLAAPVQPVPAFPPELEIPPTLELLVMTGFAKTPATRFATARPINASSTPCSRRRARGPGRARRIRGVDHRLRGPPAARFYGRSTRHRARAVIRP